MDNQFDNCGHQPGVEVFWLALGDLAVAVAVAGSVSVGVGAVGARAWSRCARE